mmetsp:Transcript_3453/g.4126  ORF Transcript_3453/g.4126 Transcript_3453/m.4126 type:complete len:104 (-) Transcript_3453:1166-1477(-)
MQENDLFSRDKYIGDTDVDPSGISYFRGHCCQSRSETHNLFRWKLEFATRFLSSNRLDVSFIHELNQLSRQQRYRFLKYVKTTFCLKREPLSTTFVRLNPPIS